MVYGKRWMISEEEINMFEKDIVAETEKAIIKKQDLIQNLWAGLNKDDIIGTKVFYFTHEEVQEKGNINFSERFKRKATLILVNVLKTNTVIGQLKAT